MTERTTLQDDLRAMGWPGKQYKRAPCCGAALPSWALVKLTPVEEAQFGIAYACGACLAGPPEPGVPDIVSDLCALIDRERDRRIEGGLTFRGARFQTRQSDRENIMGAERMASAWLSAGGDPDTLRWANPAADYGWIVEDNSTVPMSASDIVALFQTGVAFKAALSFHARELKDAVIAAADPLSVDIEAGWPT